MPARFSAEALAEARSVTPQPVDTDFRDIPFVTIDPPGSLDLDQAVHVAATSAGFVVHYAIADVASFVAPGGALDLETHERGTTLYGPDTRIPLHPLELSEGSASLLPGVDRPAVVWRIEVDEGGEIIDGVVRRGLVRSREQLTYAQAQERINAGSPELGLLRTVGELRQRCERERGGVSLDVPEQEITTSPDGSFGLKLRSTLPVEGWNAQISLLTGIFAARMMRAGGVGIFRALPPADPRDLARLRHTARALGIVWAPEAGYGDVLATVNSTHPREAAFLAEATTLFRGASYVAFGGFGQAPGVPAAAAHAAIAAEYAHVTAPLRRLVDRYGTEVCLALDAGKDVPEWVLSALGDLPETMARTGRRASAYDRGVLDVVEAALLSTRIGESLGGVVVDVDDRSRQGRRGRRGQVALAEPPVRARAEGELALGEVVQATVAEASIADRRVMLRVG